MKWKLFVLILAVCLSAYGVKVGFAEHAEHKDEHGGHHDEHADHHEEGMVHLSESSRKIIELKTTRAVKKPLFNQIHVVGDIAQDTEHVKHITAPEAGTLQSIKVRVGDVVEEGTVLAELNTREGKSIEIISPLHGIVMAKYAKENEAVDTISSILTVADPDLLRASFNVYEKDLAGIKPGLKVVVKSMAYPDQEFEGEIIFVSPQIDVKTRAIRVGVHIKNEEHLLKFGMYVSGMILVPFSDDTLVVPEEAVQNIKGKNVVFTPNPSEEDEFELKEIEIGRKAEGWVEVVSGIKENEAVVTQGSFYLKSELLKGELGHGHAH